MSNNKIVIWLVVVVLVVLSVGAGGYYYYLTVKKTQTVDNTTETDTSAKKTDAQIENEKLKDTVIQNSPEPDGIAKPNYVPAPTPPPPPTN